jgi:hypothetical protein
MMNDYKKTQEAIDNALKMSDRFDESSCSATPRERFLAALHFLYVAATDAMTLEAFGGMPAAIELAMAALGVKLDERGHMIPAGETEEQRLVRVYGGPGRLA